MRTGALVAGRFRLVRVAGRGGMGAVWEAVDEQTGGRVAVKVIALESDPLGDAQHARARFALEARALAEVRHPNVVRYLWHGVVGARGLVVMEWLDGRDLAALIARGGALAVGEALQLALGLSRALAEAHARGVVHRDLKPSNVWVVGSASPLRAADVRLLDFGLAALRPDETSVGAGAGTARYMAPEQARGEAPDARADYFSLGCVLYECLTARPAFDAERTLAALADVQSEDAPRPGARRKGLSHEVDALVLALLSREPSARPRDAGEVAALLGVALGRGSPLVVSALRWVPALFAEDGAPPPERALPLGAGRFARLAAEPGARAAQGAGDGAKRLAAEASALLRERPRCAAWLGLVRLAAAGSPHELERLAEEALREAAPGRVLVSAGLAPLLGVDVPLERGAGRTWLGSGREAEGAWGALVGREAELRLLTGTLAQCEAERIGRTLLVYGPPGIGVSSLVRAGVAGAPDTPGGWARRVARVPASDASPAPLGALRELAVELAAPAHLAEALREALPDEEDAPARASLLSLLGAAEAQGAAPPRGSPPHAALCERALLALVERARGGRSLVCVLDDAHLADAPTRAIVRSCRRATLAQPVTWILAGRPELEATWSETAREEEVLTIRLGPLRPRSAERLAARVLGPGVDEGVARQIAQRAQGHPLVVVELARLGAGEGAGLPTAVQALVEARLWGLSEQARGVLFSLAVLGERATPAILSVAVELPRAELALVLDGLRREGLVEERGASLHLPQALVRDVARGMLSANERAAVLSRAALAPEAEGPSSSSR